MKKKLLLSFLFSYFTFHISYFSFAQNSDGKYILSAKIIGNDTIPLVDLPPFEVIAPINPEAIANAQKYYKLYRDVKKTLPYAKLASAKLLEINDNMSKIAIKKEQRKYLKAEDKKLKNQFEDELKGLTVGQGKILIKLIDRETGHTTYTLVKELKGSLSAFFWQNIARLFGSNLKVEYDSTGNDKIIESIIHSIESQQKK